MRVKRLLLWTFGAITLLALAGLGMSVVGVASTLPSQHMGGAYYSNKSYRAASPSSEGTLITPASCVLTVTGSLQNDHIYWLVARDVITSCCGATKCSPGTAAAGALY